MKTFHWFLAAFVSFLAIPSVEASLIVSYEAAGVQNTTITQPTIFQSFNGNSYGTGNLSGSYSWIFDGNAIGTFSSTGSVAVSAQDQYGGSQSAMDAGTGGLQYLQIYGGTLELDLNTPQGYFGFWWSAADGANKVDITTEDGHVYDFTTSGLLDALPRDINSQYYGNPTQNFQGINSGNSTSS
jgi:hypothetical protein